MQKHCPKCKRDLPISYFIKSKSTFDGWRVYCRDCANAATNAWRDKNKERINERARARYAEQPDPSCKKYRRKLRLAAIDAYGGKCACCGEREIEYLCIDHQNGGGTKHRKELGAVTIDSWLKRNKYPSGFRVLCWNCNSSLYMYGYSPKNREFR